MTKTPLRVLTRLTKKSIRTCLLHMIPSERGRAILTCFLVRRFYPSLGAKLDFHDDLIGFSYQRQLLSDPEGAPYYLEALQGIADGRKSEDLQTYVAIEASSGKVSAQDIRKAYNALGLEIGSEYLDDDHIIGTFQSRAADSPRQEPELRRALQIIGQHRSSQRIQLMASKSTNSWLCSTCQKSNG